MLNKVGFFAILAAAVTSASNASEIRGRYLETRTCQVYTGPCFANAETGLAGKDAVMAWNIEEGEHQGVNLQGLNVVVALKSTKTLGFRGIEEAGELKAVVYLDEKATPEQQNALLDFAKQHTGRAGQEVVRVSAAPIEMALDVATLDANLHVEDAVQITARRANPDDCICSNESAYYPPLAKVENFAAGVTTVGEFRGRGLGTRWSTPGARSAYMATFVY